MLTRTQNSAKIQWHEAQHTVKIYQCGGNDDRARKSGKFLFCTHIFSSSSKIYLAHESASD